MTRRHCDALQLLLSTLSGDAQRLLLLTRASGISALAYTCNSNTQEAEARGGNVEPS